MITQYIHTAQILRDQLRAAEIDREALRQPIRSCEISVCKATCCHDGVYLSGEEKEGIEALLKDVPSILKELNRPTPIFTKTSKRNTWKTATRPAEPGELAQDYPAHFPKTRCIFLDNSGYCSIQKWSMAQGRNKWVDKPLTCWIHPLVILPKSKERKSPVLTLVNPDNDPQKTEKYPGFASCTHCGRLDKSGTPAYHVLNEELETLSILSGRNLLAEIQDS